MANVSKKVITVYIWSIAGEEKKSQTSCKEEEKDIHNLLLIYHIFFSSAILTKSFTFTLIWFHQPVSFDIWYKWWKSVYEIVKFDENEYVKKRITYNGNC